MKTIITIPAATVAAAKKIHEADAAFAAFLDETSDADRHHQIASAFIADPSEETLAALVNFEARKATLQGLRAEIFAGRLKPDQHRKLAFRHAVAGPIRRGIDELDKELAASIASDKETAAEHGQPITDSFATKALRERHAVASEVLRQVNALDSAPAKLMGKLGYSIDGQPIPDAIGKHRETVAAIASVAGGLGIAHKLPSALLDLETDHEALAGDFK